MNNNFWRNSKLQFAKSYGIIKIRNPNFRHGMTILFFVFSLWIMNTHAHSSSPVNWRPRPPGYFWICNFLFADSASVDAWSWIQIRTFLNVLSRVEIFEYVMSPAGIVWKLNPGSIQPCSLPWMHIFQDGTERNVNTSLLLGLQFQVL